MVTFSSPVTQPSGTDGAETLEAPGTGVEVFPGAGAVYVYSCLYDTEFMACLVVVSHFVRTHPGGGFGCGRVPIGIIVSGIYGAYDAPYETVGNDETGSDDVDIIGIDDWIGIDVVEYGETE